MLPDAITDAPLPDDESAVRRNPRLPLGLEQREFAGHAIDTIVRRRADGQRGDGPRLELGMSGVPDDGGRNPLALGDLGEFVQLPLTLALQNDFLLAALFPLIL